VANITASRVSRDRTRKLRMFQASGYLTLDLGAGSGEPLALAWTALREPFLQFGPWIGLLSGPRPDVHLDNIPTIG
jgi:hypothetical protein